MRRFTDKNPPVAKWTGCISFKKEAAKSGAEESGLCSQCTLTNNATYLSAGLHLRTVNPGMLVEISICGINNLTEMSETATLVSGKCHAFRMENFTHRVYVKTPGNDDFNLRIRKRSLKYSNY